MLVSAVKGFLKFLQLFNNDSIFDNDDADDEADGDNDK